jgi:hypothetical protein
MGVPISSNRRIRIGIAVLHPECHLPDELGADPLLVIVGVDHFVIEIVFRKAVAVAGADGPGPLLDS